jgi:hypothetical protein
MAVLAFAAVPVAGCGGLSPGTRSAVRPEFTLVVHPGTLDVTVNATGPPGNA